MPPKDAALEDAATVEELDNAFALELLRLCRRYQLKEKAVLSTSISDGIGEDKPRANGEEK